MAKRTTAADTVADTVADAAAGTATDTATRVEPARFRVTSVWDRGIVWLADREPSENVVLLVFAVATGVLSALGVVAFYKSIDAAYTLFYRWPATYFPHVAVLAYRPIITAAGFAFAWWIMRRIGRGHEGMNVPDVQLAVVRRGGNVPGRPAFARTAASAITIGSGGSAGSEGPVVVLGAAVGSWLGRVFRFAPSRVNVLVGCATGAAISAAFNAPLAGAFFALEEILGTFSGASFAPVVVASVIAAVISRGVFGNHPAFPIPTQYGYVRPSEIVLFYPLLGIVSGLVAAIFVRTYFAVGSMERRLVNWKIPKGAIPWIGGLFVGAIVVASRGLLVGYGHFAVHLDVFGRMAWYALFLLAIGKILATSVTLNLGGSGGVFTPSLYIGAATGGAFGVALAALFPQYGLHPEAYALVGMGAMIAGATDAPITGIMLVFEMTDDYAVVLPLMMTVVISHVVARRFEPDSLYSGWLRRRGESIGHGTDRDVLADLRVRDAYEAAPQVIDEGASVYELVRHLGETLGHTDQTYFPVVDDQHHMIGIVTVVELGRLGREMAVNGDEFRQLLLAADIAQPTESVHPGDSLLDAIRKMGVRGAASLPVVDPATGKLLGLISRSHVLDRYEVGVSGRPAVPA
ncbi:MAG: chloride channel protein [Gemmatimonadaceae bacterium]